ncbi:hypothetical protein OF83DRAFT_1173200 [Amylostereum chailletii]|nr:hypothetical protein OF83DRAFT_1173200 [Amylostereum chailletii]
MAPSTPRRHRLPQHRDYVLVPKPADFTLNDQKSPLPAIIVTPSSPSCSADFSIAFIAPTPEPGVLERVTSYLAPLQLKARTTLLLLLLFFLMASHLLTHRLATSHPHLQFDAAPPVPSDLQDAPMFAGWFDWKMFSDVPMPNPKVEFVVADVELVPAEVTDASSVRQDPPAVEPEAVMESK